MKKNVQSLLNKPRLEAAVKRYFDPAERTFAGTTFLDLEPNDPFAFGPADILAASLLDVGIRAGTVRIILWDDAWRRTTDDLLHHIPEDVDIWDDGARLGRDSPAWKLYDHLVALDGIAETKATKLMARKRPRLVPIVDKIVKRVLEPATSYWAETQEILRETRVRERLKDLRNQANLPVTFPLLRVFDAVLWMEGSGSKWVAAAWE